MKIQIKDRSKSNTSKGFKYFPPVSGDISSTLCVSVCSLWIKLPVMNAEHIQGQGLL